MMTNYGKRLTQGQFSFLPDLTDAQIAAQIAYALKQGWAVNVEYTDDPHPRNTYWEMFGLPMFDPDAGEPSPSAERLIESCYAADGMIWSSPSLPDPRAYP